MTQMRTGRLLDVETLSGTGLLRTSINIRLGLLLSEALRMTLTGLFGNAQGPQTAI